MRALQQRAFVPGDDSIGATSHKRPDILAMESACTSMEPRLIDADALWGRLRAEASKLGAAEPILASHLRTCVLERTSIVDALSHLLARKLATAELAPASLVDVFSRAFASGDVTGAICSDLLAIADRDPAAHGVANPFLNYKGFHALEAYRACHHLWTHGRGALASHLQGRASEVLAVDIHPAARIGHGVFIDHGTGLVIGETAVVGNDVSILQNVTLGGTGKSGGDRHPKIGNGVLIGAGAKVLGNIRVGEGAKIGAGSVVLRDVPSHTTVVGVPARTSGHPKSEEPGSAMDQAFDDEPEG